MIIAAQSSQRQLSTRFGRLTLTTLFVLILVLMNGSKLLALGIVKASAVFYFDCHSPLLPMLAVSV